MSIEFRYAQARAQARHGDRLQQAEWRAAEATDDLAHYLHTVRATSLSALVQHFKPSSSPHVIERFLRGVWRDEVDRASRWVPDVWQEAVRWTAWLPYLPALAHILNDGMTLPWMRADPVLAAFAAEDPDERRHAIAESPFAEPADTKTGDLLAWWQGQWRSRLPEGSAPDLQELVDALHTYRSAAASGAWQRKTADEQHELLEQRIARLLHTRTGEPVLVFCHLALTALELQRLRRGLIRRAIFNAVSEDAGS